MSAFLKPGREQAPLLFQITGTWHEYDPSTEAIRSVLIQIKS